MIGRAGLAARSLMQRSRHLEAIGRLVLAARTSATRLATEMRLGGTGRLLGSRLRGGVGIRRAIATATSAASTTARGLRRGIALGSRRGVSGSLGRHGRRLVTRGGVGIRLPLTASAATTSTRAAATRGRRAAFGRSVALCAGCRRTCVTGVRSGCGCVTVGSGLLGSSRVRVGGSSATTSRAGATGGIRGCGIRGGFGCFALGIALVVQKYVLLSPAPRPSVGNEVHPSLTRMTRHAEHSARSRSGELSRFNRGLG